MPQELILTPAAPSVHSEGDKQSPGPRSQQGTCPALALLGRAVTPRPFHPCHLRGQSHCEGGGLRTPPASARAHGIFESCLGPNLPLDTCAPWGHFLGTQDPRWESICPNASHPRSDRSLSCGQLASWRPWLGSGLSLGQGGPHLPLHNLLFAIILLFFSKRTNLKSW